MRLLRILAIDLALMSVALLAAITLRDNLDLTGERLGILFPYWLSTLLIAAVVLPLSGVTDAVWRFSSMRNYLTIAAASGAIIGGALALTFIINRLEGVPRALPLIQALVTIVLLVSARISARLWHHWRWQLARPQNTITTGGETVLLVGVSKLAELYLHCIADYARDQVHVAGLLDSHANVGLSLLSQRVLGAPERVADVVRDLEIHGVVVKRIVVAVPFECLSSKARSALLQVGASTAISLELLDQKIGLARAAGQGKPADAASRSQGRSGALDRADANMWTQSSYCTVKRALDVAVASIFLIILMPIMMLVALVVAADVGLPVLFWQQRPGRGGRPFKVRKFRTMGAAHDAHGRRKPDAQRISQIGHFLRRTRLDELPQLFSILTGHMSFVGPRPLLPVDQPAEYSARLLVRPGLTGWAQIKGGRTISAIDKAALDMWYVKNMSFVLDVKIAVGTIPMILFGDRVENEAIVQAWQELKESRI